MASQIVLSPSANTLTVKLDQDFDLSAERLLSTASRLASRLCCICVLDFAAVETVQDSGVSLLVLLRRRLGPDAEIRIINCRDKLMERLRSDAAAALGLAA